MDEKKLVPRKKHQVVLKGREQLAIEGVQNVESFDDQEILLETEVGMLVVRGEDLHIKELNLESGALQVEGFVRMMEYAGDVPGKKKGGLMGKLFR